MQKKAIYVLRIPQIIFYLLAVGILLYVAWFFAGVTNFNTGEYPDYVSGYVVVGSMIGTMFAMIAVAVIIGGDIIVWGAAILHTFLMHMAKKAYDTDGKEKRLKVCLRCCQIIDLLMGMILFSEGIRNWSLIAWKIGIAAGGFSIMVCSCLSIYFWHIASGPCKINSGEP